MFWTTQPRKSVVSNLQQSLGSALFVLRFYGPVNPMGSCRARYRERIIFPRKQLFIQTSSRETTWKEYWALFSGKIYIAPDKRGKQLTLKVPNKICSRWHSFFFFFSEKTHLDISCESSAWQMIHMKCQDLFSLKNKKKIKKIVVCCSCDWRFQGKIYFLISAWKHVDTYRSAWARCPGASNKVPRRF